MLTRLSVTIYIGIDRATAVFDPTPGVKVSLLYDAEGKYRVYMLLHI